MLGKQRLVLVGTVAILAFSIMLFSVSTSTHLVNADDGEPRIAVLETMVSRQNAQLDQLQAQIDRINVALSLSPAATQTAANPSGKITFQLAGNSMAPTLIKDQIVIVDLEAYQSNQPQRGDIILFNPPVTTDAPYLKRVIGIAGDTIEIREDGFVYLNNQLLTEPYVTNSSTDCMMSCEAINIPIGEIYVLGDSRANSSDSRIFGTVPVENVLGKVILD